MSRFARVAKGSALWPNDSQVILVDSCHNDDEEAASG